LLGEYTAWFESLPGGFPFLAPPFSGIPVRPQLPVTGLREEQIYYLLKHLHSLVLVSEYNVIGLAGWTARLNNAQLLANPLIIGNVNHLFDINNRLKASFRAVSDMDDCVDTQALISGFEAPAHTSLAIRNHLSDVSARL
jgi:hypothetical protein